MSGNFLLKSIGGDAMSTDDLMYILFPEDYFGKIIDETPTIEEMQEHVRVECMPLPPDFQKGDFEKRVTAIAQAMVDTYTDEARRDKFKGQLQNIVDLIFNKLPPNTENRVYWNNICVAIIGETVGEHDEYGEDGKKRLVELEGKFSTLKAAMEDRAAMKS
jgi:hypothetical protein